MKVQHVELVLGAWVLISPWVLGESNIVLMKWSNVVVGIILILASVWSLYGRESTAADKA